MPEQRQPQAAVLGAGTWGLVLAKLLHDNGCAVRAWDYFPQVIEKLKAERAHPRFAGWRIPEEIALTSDLAEAARGAELVVFVVPSTAMRQTCAALRAAGIAAGPRIWVICSKGIEAQTLLPMSDVALDALGPEAAGKICVLTGPSHAEEVAQNLPTSVVACAANPAVAQETQRLFFQPRFRVYTNDDVLGAELGGSLKNVIAIAAGVADGMGFGDNTRAALITRSLTEIIRLGEAMGARRETFMGLSGLGDLIVTASSRHSRNHQFGELLAQGRTAEEALKEVGMVVEGYNTVKAACGLGRKYNVQMPISEAVHGVLFEGLPARKALEALLSRGAKSELG